MGILDIFNSAKRREAKWLADFEKAVMIEIPEQTNDYKDTAFEWNIVGELNYQDEIRACHNNKKTNEHAGKAVMLRYENDNPHDAKAVMAMMDGNIVGYLDKENALTFRRKIKAYLKKTGKDDTGMFICPAIITGGHIKRDGKQASFGITIDLPFPD